MTRRGVIGWLALITGLALAAVIHVSTPNAPAVYDGLPPPEGPYRYLSPPPSLASSNQPPLSGVHSLPVQAGEVRGGGLQTDDGQAGIFFEGGALRPSPTAESVMIRIDPISAPPAPPHFVIRGNVYRITALEQPTGAPVRIARSIQVTLRFPPGPFGQLQLFDGRSWHQLRLSRITGSYASASLSRFGDVAVTEPYGRATRLTFLDLVRRLPTSAAAAVSAAVILVVLTLGAVIRGRRR